MNAIIDAPTPERVWRAIHDRTTIRAQSKTEAI
jgi:hypothetical protein